MPLGTACSSTDASYATACVYRMLRRRLIRYRMHLSHAPRTPHKLPHAFIACVYTCADASYAPQTPFRRRRIRYRMRLSHASIPAQTPHALCRRLIRYRMLLSHASIRADADVIGHENKRIHKCMYITHIAAVCMHTYICVLTYILCHICHICVCTYIYIIPIICIKNMHTHTHTHTHTQSHNIYIYTHSQIYKPEHASVRTTLSNNVG
jgi:hypothetical protein